MSGLPEFLLTPFGQGRKQQGRSDYDENFREQYRKGEIERDGVETFFDNLLRGGSEKIQAAAQQRHIDLLEQSNPGKYLLDNRDREFKATDTHKGLRRDALAARGEDEAIVRLVQAGYEEDTSKLKGRGKDYITSLIAPTMRDTRTKNYDSDPAVIEALNRQGIEDIRYQSNQDYIRSQDQNRRLDRNLDKQMNVENNMMQLQLEYARMSQSDRQRIADRKDQAIMALLSGLGNLGAAFTV